MSERAGRPKPRAPLDARSVAAASGFGFALGAMLAVNRFVHG